MSLDALIFLAAFALGKNGSAIFKESNDSESSQFTDSESTEVPEPMYGAFIESETIWPTCEGTFCREDKLSFTDIYKQIDHLKLRNDNKLQ